MGGNVLVLGDGQGLREALDLLLLGRSRVRHAFAAGDTEGIGVEVVVVAGPGIAEHVRDVRVHPRMNGVPIIALTADPSHLPAAAGLSSVDSTRVEVLDELTERVSRVLARSSHPSFGKTRRHAGAA